MAAHRLGPATQHCPSARMTNYLVILKASEEDAGRKKQGEGVGHHS